MKIVLITFEQFTDVDVYLPWNLLNRVKRPDWTVRILADSPRVTSRTGLGLEVHGPLSEAREADAVIITSGDLTRTLSKDAAFLAKLELAPSRQLIGSMCSGALILGAKGLLRGLTATTYPTAWKELEAFGATAVQDVYWTLAVEVHRAGQGGRLGATALACEVGLELRPNAALTGGAAAA